MRRPTRPALRRPSAQLFTENPGLLVPLVRNLAAAWIWTVDQRVGLFSGRPRGGGGAAPANAADADAGGVEAAVAAGPGAEEGPSDENDPDVLRAISAHDVWLSHLSELWTVLRRRGGAVGAAAREQFARLLNASLAEPRALSAHAASLGPRFRLLQLAVHFARDLASDSGGAPPAAVLLLFDQSLRAVGGRARGGGGVAWPGASAAGGLDLVSGPNCPPASCIPLSQRFAIGRNCPTRSHGPRL